MKAFYTLAALLFLTTAANSQDNIPRGLGHPAGGTHWYDGGCCSMQDCEPVEPGAIRQTEQGYYVRYLTSRGFVAEGFLPYGHTGIRPSRDHQEHACSTAVRVLCIYIPMMM